MKIVKFFVVFNLILSISLINSVAAISVSDGSAFVTKAEFAADLNNLSNRMSTLENSLDAKIDSLVSSYLSRNGIWNGEKQEIKNDTFKAYFSVKTQSAYIRSIFFNSSSSSLGFQGDRVNLKTLNQYFKDDKVVLIEKINKSGLLFLQFNVQSYDGEGSMRFVAAMTSNSSLYIQNVNGSYSDQFTIYNGDGVVKYNESLVTGIPLYGYFYFPTQTNKLISFFVEKEETLTISTGVTLYMSNSLLDGAYTNLGRKWKFSSAYVY